MHKIFEKGQTNVLNEPMSGRTSVTNTELTRNIIEKIMIWKMVF